MHTLIPGQHHVALTYAGFTSRVPGHATHGAALRPGKSPLMMGLDKKPPVGTSVLIALHSESSRRNQKGQNQTPMARCSARSVQFGF